MVTQQRIGALPTITDITREQVMKVYSGRPGCGCGCKGRYYVNPDWLAHINKDGSGNTYDTKDVSLAQVTRVLNVLKARIEDVVAQDDGDEIIYSIQDDRRYYWVYVPTQKLA